MGRRLSIGCFYWKSSREESTGWNGIRIAFPQSFVQSQRHAACRFSLEVSNYDQTTHDRTITLEMDLAECEAYLVKREALEAGAKHEAPGSGTKYASRTTFHASKTLHAQAQRIRACSRRFMNNAG